MDLATPETPIDTVKDLLDALEPPRCEWQEELAPRCEDQATSALVLSCGHSIFYCEPHREERQGFLDSPGALQCRKTVPWIHKRAAMVDYEWREL